MRRFGGLALLLGLIGYFYCSSEKGKYGAVPDGMSIGQTLQHPAGKWELRAYGCAVLAAFGGLMLMFPQGR
jgi:hypothetical protein